MMWRGTPSTEFDSPRQVWFTCRVSENAAPAPLPAALVPACDDEFGCGAAAGEPCAPGCLALADLDADAVLDADPLNDLLV